MFVPCSNSLLDDDYSDYILILPSSSVRSIGQLTVDLLISTLQCQLIGYWHHANLLPVIGNGSLNDQQDTNQAGNYSSTLVTPSQVYISRQHKLVIVQIRSPLIQGGSKVFCTDLVNWIRYMNFQLIIMVTSSYFHEKINADIGRGFRYLVSRKANQLSDRLEKDLAWVPLEKCPYIIDGMVDKDYSDKILIAGGGFAKQFFLECDKEDVSLVLMTSLCIQENNFAMAFQLASYLNDWLQFLPKQTSTDISVAFKGELHCPGPWITPTSWQTLLDQQPPSGIY